VELINQGFFIHLQLAVKINTKN